MKTVKVKIAVEIGPSGRWQAHGYTDAESWHKLMETFEPIEEGAQRHWVEAEVPVPDAEPAVVAGKAVEVEPV